MTAVTTPSSFLGTDHGTEEVTAVVRDWLTRSQGRPIAASARLLASLLRHEGGLAFLTQFVDTVIRPEDAKVAAAGFVTMSRQVGPFLPWYQRRLIALGALFAPLLPHVVVWAAKLTVRAMVSHLIVDASPRTLGGALARLRNKGSRLNVNLLGEAVLGNAEAARRLERTTALLKRNDVDYVSLKVSAAIGPHNPWGFDSNVDHIVGTLTPLFETAATLDGRFINLDMEEYRDLDLTVAVFTTLLSKPQFQDLTAGIVLQAYLPDSLPAYFELLDWAQARVATGGAPIKIRLVKGANLSMERVDAQLHGWPLATWESKAHSDAHYKRLIDQALRPERVGAVRVGVAGHNLFDIAHAWLTAKERGVTDALEFEMLLGMGEHVASVVAEDTGPLRLYTPVVHPQEFDVALAYLVRRLEEVGSRANFMSSLYELANDATAFGIERERFEASWELMTQEAVPSYRRLRAVGEHHVTAFKNAADADPSLASTRQWAREIVEGAHKPHGEATLKAARLNAAHEVTAAIAKAAEAGRTWAATPVSERAEVLMRVADVLEEHRAELIQVMMADASKTLDQADPEVSEAVDFARYYALRALELDKTPGAAARPRGVTVVAPPWNFPVAIPAGSTLAALATGSAVVLKPAEQAPRCGAYLAQLLWEAGVPREVLTLIDIDPARLGAALIGDEAVEQVILTGAFDTAQHFVTQRPGLRVLAETSGKNAIVVTPSADMDLAVKDIVASAFGHQGQKCSAASLAVLVGPVARSRRFLTQLEDAVKSLKAGPADGLTTQIAPLNEVPHGKLLRALTELDAGESWLVQPQLVGGEGLHWSPGVRTGVKPGSFFHLTECFGPVLGLIAVDTLEEALEVVNAVDYGLTAGIHSLDPDEVEQWIDTVEAGNLYVNRGTTGAIVQRQPFGGWKQSTVGPTFKAGGPHYLQAVSAWEPAPLDPEAPKAELWPRVERLLEAGHAPAWVWEAAKADEHAWQSQFGIGLDRTGLTCEANVLRYRPVVIDIRWEATSDLADVVRVLAAARRAGATGVLSGERAIPVELGHEVLGDGIEVRSESWDACVARVVRRGGGRIRRIGAPAGPAPAQVAVFDGPVTSNPALEMMPFLKEQAISITTHRFGTPYAPMLQVARSLTAH